MDNHNELTQMKSQLVLKNKNKLKNSNIIRYLNKRVFEKKKDKFLQAC